MFWKPPYDGTVVETKGQPDTGMVQDFGTFKSVMMDAVGEPWDHCLPVLHNHDGYMLNALANSSPCRKAQDCAPVRYPDS
jgi:6-pyruvoyl-tetrahydropterin synthase